MARPNSKPFLLISIRAEERAAHDEYAAFARLSGLGGDLRRISLVEESLADIRLEEWSGIFLGGGSWCVSDPVKSAVQRRGEAELATLLGQVLDRDFPFLGACYGIGTLAQAIGATMDRRHPEDVGPMSVTLTPDGMSDPIMVGLPRRFAAYGGHKEAMGTVPQEATVLATSTACPVQGLRVGRNVYAFQFHPELDREGLETRIEVYSSFGYFDPAEAEAIKRRSALVEVIAPAAILTGFVARHRR